MATLSFVHEYVHFLQSCSSLMGFNTLEQLINVGIGAAVRLSGLDGPQQNLSIFTLLEALPDHAGQSHGEIREKMQSLADEMVVLTTALDVPYEGNANAWDLLQHNVVYGTYRQDHWGFVTERRTFCPFTPLIPIEGAAPRVDRWFAANEGYVGHQWTACTGEDEVYNGLRNLLLRPRYSHLVTEANVDEITVLVGSLALLTPHTDWSVSHMLQLIERTSSWVPVDELERLLRRFLIEQDELHAEYFNQTMNTLLLGNTRMIVSSEFMPIYEQLRLIHAAASRVLSGPGALFRPNINWQSMQQLMRQFSVPPVVVSDGTLLQVGGVDSNRDLHRLIAMIRRKLF